MKKLLTAALLLIAFTYYSNNAIEITPYTLESDKWPQALDGYTIVHLSDLQSKSYGRNQNPLLKKIEALNPDLIVFTGDLIDRRHYAKKPALELMAGCLDIAPTAYVTGNHEIWHGTANALKAELLDLGVFVLDNKSAYITDSGASFVLTGVADRADFKGQYDYEQALSALSNKTDLAAAPPDTSATPSIEKSLPSPFQILLSHRPEEFDVYAKDGFDLVFSGHSHGGQFRLPFLGGLFAPNQGLLPQFDGGLYVKNTTSMVVSRGLGNSIIPIRLFNQPEIPVITLKSKS